MEQRSVSEVGLAIAVHRQVKRIKMESEKACDWWPKTSREKRRDPHRQKISPSPLGSAGQNL
ncbi:hypothetical protein CDL15_Pgr019945 [Punica granatum]|uniref:Uncharacterized protein n=1 Tax=Punica granatum TaxID=22663 RepID=A0A218VRK2_PUNGR|nr:hypothetical protein CDL15_Pgr019945 [Punica granatum]PKI76719.1 hypothetical protein CRG98_002887 [Punica granatum]